MIFWGILIEALLILAIDYTPWGNALFGIAPLSPGVWLCAAAFGLFLWGMEDLHKLVVHKGCLRAKLW